MAEYEWDFESLTTYTFTQELIRGTYKNTTRNDQLYIWIKEKDMDYLNKNFAEWLQIENIQESGYKRVVVHMSLNKKYPMSIIYLSGCSETSELNMKELGNVAACEAATVNKYNTTLADDERFDVNFGAQSSKSLIGAMQLGMKYRQFATDLQELGYLMISTVDSGLITSTL